MSRLAFARSQPGSRLRVSVLAVVAALAGPAAARSQGEAAEKALESPAQLWQRVRDSFPAPTYQVESDGIVTSDTDPKQKLRRVQVRFRTQSATQWRRHMDHTAVIHLPADPSTYMAPDRLGKLVVVAKPYNDATFVAGNPSTPFDDPAFVANIGEPITARTGYPSMVLAIPGEYDGMDGENSWLDLFEVLTVHSRDPADHNYFRLAICYMRALDVFAGVVGIDPPQVRAIIGGHSKRATSAFTAAAIDPERIVGVVYMGNESTFDSFGPGSPFRAISPAFTQKWVKADVLYLGGTNEDGYQMFNINRIQSMMQRPWTIEYIPNQRHDCDSETHFIDWRMWVSHVFDGRPITRISDLRQETTPDGTRFRARIESQNRLIQVRAWYVYSDDEYWRDLMWYPVTMRPSEQGYEGFLEGVTPDAWMVEVKDISLGSPGYVSSLPQDITHKPTKRRYSQGSVPRLWKLKPPARK